MQNLSHALCGALLTTAALCWCAGCGQQSGPPRVTGIKPTPVAPALNIPTESAAAGTSNVKVIAIVAKLLNIRPDKINAQSRFKQDLGADSLDVCEIVMACEDTFKVTIPDVGLEKVQTIQDLCRVVDSLPREPGPQAKQ